MQPYIYIITDTRNGMRYVGKHNGKMEDYFCSGNVIKSIIKKNGLKKAKSFLKKEIIVQGDFNPVLLNELERHYIRLKVTRDPLGYNLTDGGDGCDGNQGLKKIAWLWANDPEYRRKEIEKNKQRSNSPEHKARAREASKKYSNTQEVKNKISLTLTGHPSPKKGKPMKSSQIEKLKKYWQENKEERVKRCRETKLKGKTPLVQFSLEMNPIKIWPNLKEAKIRTGFKDISLAASNHKKTASGFKWKFLSDLNDQQLEQIKQLQK